jgi:hypothetical protein
VTEATRCRCEDPLASRYGPDQACWHCWQAAHGGDGTIPEPEVEEFVDFEDVAAVASALAAVPERVPTRTKGLGTAVRELVERLERALGPSVCTPEWVMAADYRETRRLERARYRVFRWRCPSCGGGEDDPLQIYRPFVVDSDGNVRCDARGCYPDRLEARLRDLIGGVR